MLKRLRNKKTAKKIWIILGILVLPAFVLWGSGSLIRSKQEPTYAGRIFGKKISFLEYKDAVDATRNQMIIQSPEKFSEKEKQPNLESQAWYRLILLAEAKKRKIKASDKEVIGLIRSYPFFQKNGQFDNRIYSEMLEYVFHAPARIFEEQIRQNLILSKLYNTVTSAIGLSDTEIRETYQKENEEISIYYIASLASDFTKEITATDQELKDYFTKNSLEFKQPPSFNIEYVSLESEDKTKSFILRLNKKEGFIKIAQDLGLSVKESGWLGLTDPIPGIGWSPEILNLISKAKVGEFLPPINKDKNYYILRLKGKREPYIPDFETIKDKVKERFAKDKSQGMAKQNLENCLKKLKEDYQVGPQAVDFDKTAKVYGLKSGSTGPFKYGSYIQDIGASDNFWMSALGLKDDEFSDIITTPSGFYIIKLKSRIPIDQKKFETEKTEFAQRLLLQKKQEYFINFVEELKKETEGFF